MPEFFIAIIFVRMGEPMIYSGWYIEALRLDGHLTGGWLGTMVRSDIACGNQVGNFADV